MPGCPGSPALTIICPSLLSATTDKQLSSQCFDRGIFVAYYNQTSSVLYNPRMDKNAHLSESMRSHGDSGIVQLDIFNEFPPRTVDPSILYNTSRGPEENLSGGHFKRPYQFSSNPEQAAKYFNLDRMTLPTY